VPLAGQRWSMIQVAAMLHKTGMRGAGVAIAVAVVFAESGGYDRAYNDNGPTRGCPNGSRDRGLGQINSCYHSEVSNTCAYNAQCNLYAVARISGYGRSFTQWSTYNSGAYKRHLPAAAAAYRQYLGHGIPGGVPVFPGAAPTAKPSSLRQAIQFASSGIGWLLSWVRSGVERVAEAAAMYVWNKTWDFIVKLTATARILLAVTNHFKGTFYRWVRALLHKIDVTAHRLQVWTGNLVAKAIVTVVTRITNWVRGTVMPWVRGLVLAARILAQGLFKVLRDWTARALAALGNRIAGVLTWAAGRIAELREWARKAIDWLTSRLVDVMDWVARYGPTLVAFVTRALGWIVWLIANPIGRFIQLWHDLAQLTPRLVLSAVLSAVAREGDVIERWLARWLG